MRKRKIILTGANGFIGQRFQQLHAADFDIRAVSFQHTDCYCGIDFHNIDSIVHLAGIVHHMKKIDDAIYFNINHKKTIELAREAKAMGVRHFVFASTVRVYGENAMTVSKRYLSDEDAYSSLNEKSPTQPTDAYGKSKLMAEEDLLKMEDSHFQVAIVRPPLVYGPRVKGNLLRLLQLVNKNYPWLPFGGIHNRRSMVYVDNLVALMGVIVGKSASGVFLSNDNELLSTTELMSYLIQFCQKNTRLIKLPNMLKELIHYFRPDLSQRLFGSFVVDPSYTYQTLGFTPPIAAEAGIQKMCEWYQSNLIND